MMSSMFEIPILYVACDVKIVKKRVSLFCSRVLRKKYSYKKEFMFWRAFFFEKKLFLGREEGSRRETNRTESKLFLFKNLLLLNLPSLTKRSLGRGRWRRCARTNGKRGRCRIRCRRKGKRSRRRRRRRWWWLRSRWFFTHQRRCRWSW